MLSQSTFFPDGFDINEVLEIAPLLVAAGLLLLAFFGLRSLATRSIGDSATRYRVRKALTYIGAVLVFILLLGTLSSRFAQLSVAIGAIGAATVFAMQEVIASIAGWIALSFGNFFKPGDRVELGGIKGDVIDIGLLRSTLMEIGAWSHGDQYSGRMVRVANSFVFKQPVFNYSSEFPFLWDEIQMSLRLGSDIDRAKDIVLKAAESQVGDYTARSESSWKHVAQRFLIEAAQLAPMATIALTDGSIVCTVRYIVDYKRRGSTKDAITCRILAAIAESDGAVQFASQSVEVTGLPRLDVRRDS